MTVSRTQTRGASWGRGIGIGIGVAVLTGIVSVILTRTGVAPFPEPPALAFAETILGAGLPVAVGLLFHAVYVTFWSAVYIRFSPRRGFWPAILLAAILWVGVLVVFFPIVGWGVAGTGIGPQLIPAAAVPHLLFGLFLWAFDRTAPGPQG